jgi:hypothetical protein
LVAYLSQETAWKKCKHRTKYTSTLIKDIHNKFKRNKTQLKAEFKNKYKLIQSKNISKTKAKENKLEYGRRLRIATLNVRGLIGKVGLTKREQIEK